MRKRWRKGTKKKKGKEGRRGKKRGDENGDSFERSEGERERGI